MAWPHYPYVEGIYDKHNLLYKVAHGQTAGDPVNLAYPSRTNYQKVTLFSDLQDAVKRHAGGTGGIGAGYGWIVQKSYDGLAPVGISGLAFQVLDFAWLVANVPLPQGDFTRKCYREVTDNTSTTDIFTGQSIANGQRAYRRSDHQIVDRVAGAWVVNSTAREPDIITTGGSFTGGDLIGDWLFTEIEACLNLLGWRQSDGAWVPNGYIFASNPGGSSSSEAAEKSACETAYSGATPTTGSSSPQAQSDMTLDPTGTTWSGDLIRQVCYGTKTGISTLMTAVVDFYDVGKSPTGLSGDFLDEGDTILNGQLKKWASNVAVVSGTATSGNHGSITSTPNAPWCATPSAGSSSSQGWQTIYGATGPQVIIKYS